MARSLPPVRSLSQMVDGTEYLSKFGANAEDIQITMTDTSTGTTIQCTLLDFFRNWQDFKNNGNFFYYGYLSNTDAANLPDQVRFWYKAEQA